jgi:hypothetical protein
VFRTLQVVLLVVGGGVAAFVWWRKKQANSPKVRIECLFFAIRGPRARSLILLAVSFIVVVLSGSRRTSQLTPPMSRKTT